MSKILIIDDDIDFRGTLRDILAYKNYDIHIADNGQEGLEMLADTLYDLVIVDLKMPVLDGNAFLEQYQTVSPGTSVMVLTGYGTKEAVMTALQQRAVDFVDKPIEHITFLERVEALITYYEAGDFTADTVAQTVRYKGKLAQLSGSEKAILMAFIKRPNTLITYEQLVRLLDKDTDDPVRTLGPTMFRVRKKVRQLTGEDLLSSHQATGKGKGFFFSIEKRR